MAHFQTTIETRAPAKLAFEYLADFANARLWDPSVTAGRRLTVGPVEEGTRFALELSMLGQNLELEYEVLQHEPHRLVVLQAETPYVRSLDTIEVEARADGCLVRYDADLRPIGPLVLFDLPIHLGFQWVGAQAVRGLESALDRMA